MKKLFLLLSVFARPVIPSYGQTTVIDAKLIGTLVENHAVTMSFLKPMVEATEEIREYQEDIAAKTFVMRVIKDKLYESLYEVSAIIKEGKNVMAASEIVNEIGRCQADMIAYAKDNPKLTLIAYKAEAALVARTANLMAYIFNNALVGGDKNLINSKQRMEIIRYVIKELRMMRALAFNVSMRMKVASKGNAIGSIYPIYPQQDAVIVKDILNKL